MRLLFGKKQNGPSEASVATQHASNTSSKEQPLLIDDRSGAILSGKIQVGRTDQRLVAEKSYSSEEDFSPSVWGEKVGPIPMPDEWGNSYEPESRDPDPELGACAAAVSRDQAHVASPYRNAPAQNALVSQHSPLQQEKQGQLERSDSSDDQAFALMRQGPLPNPETLVMAQLIQWKFAAEEGSVALRIPAVLGSVALMITTILPYIFMDSCFTAGHMILSFFVLIHGLLICVVDGRSNYNRDPLGQRAKFRNFVTRHLNVLRLVWGRGILYILVGLVNMAHEIFICYVSGLVMTVIGLIAMISGLRAYTNLLTLRRSISDKDFLWLEFIKHDVRQQGFLNPSEFAQFIWDLGLEFDDIYTLKAFNTIDTNHDQRISFRQFERWWSQIQLNIDSQVI